MATPPCSDSSIGALSPTNPNRKWGFCPTLEHHTFSPPHQDLSIDPSQLSPSCSAPNPSLLYSFASRRSKTITPLSPQSSSVPNEEAPSDQVLCSQTHYMNSAPHRLHRKL